MARSIHRTAFDEGAKEKLELFRNYTLEWLPVWIFRARPQAPITVGDFFAGPGESSEGIPGSPLIVLEELRKSSDQIRKKGAKVKLRLNESAKGKARSLQKEADRDRVLFPALHELSQPPPCDHHAVRGGGNGRARK